MITTLEKCKPGDRVQLAGGDTATVVLVSFSRVRVRLDRRRTREFDARTIDDTTGGVITKHVVANSVIERDIAPAAEVSLLSTQD